MLNEEAVVDQLTYNEQGTVGTRRWSLDQGDDVDGAMLLICESHWPGKPDVLPVNVTIGAFFEGAVINPGEMHQRTHTLGKLPKYGKYAITAHYQLFKLTNCWPDSYPKPWHPKGTTLTLRVRGSGQKLLMSPAGVRLSQEGLCNPAEPVQMAKPEAVSTVHVSVSEFHLTCDRMTRLQVDKAFSAFYGGQHWDMRGATLNSDRFLLSPKGTLMFDNYELDETFVPHPVIPVRYRLTAVLRRRNIVTSEGIQVLDCNNEYVGWNHAFAVETKRGGRWQFINILNDNYQCASSAAAVKCRPLYEYATFCNLFGTPHSLPHGTSCASEADMTCGSAGSDGTSFTSICAGHDSWIPSTSAK